MKTGVDFQPAGEDRPTLVLYQLEGQWKKLHTKKKTWVEGAHPKKLTIKLASLYLFAFCVKDSLADQHVLIV
jgi:hypothetical protein